jgi:hypothetical protein
MNSDLFSFKQVLQIQHGHQSPNRMQGNCKTGEDKTGGMDAYHASVKTNSPTCSA